MSLRNLIFEYELRIPSIVLILASMFNEKHKVSQLSCYNWYTAFTPIHNFQFFTSTLNNVPWLTLVLLPCLHLQMAIYKLSIINKSPFICHLNILINHAHSLIHRWTIEHHTPTSHASTRLNVINCMTEVPPPNESKYHHKYHHPMTKYYHPMMKYTTELHYRIIPCHTSIHFKPCLGISLPSIIPNGKVKLVSRAMVV